MKEAILHIGYPKAGSSALQTTLAASRIALREAGFFYPDAPSGLHNALTAHFHPLADTLWPYVEMPDPDTRRAAMRRDFATLERRLDRQAQRRVILSSESLIALQPDGIARLREWLATRTERVRIVCYVRHPVPYASSLIQERVKQGESLRDVAGLVPTGKLREALPAWAEAFGRGNVVVRALERGQLTGGEVVADFAALIGYDGALDRSQQYRNASLSHAAILLLSAVHALPAPQRARAAGLAWLKQIPGPGFRLPEEWLDRVRKAAEPELAYLEAEWGVRFDDAGGAAAEEPFGAEALSFIARHLAA